MQLKRSITDKGWNLAIFAALLTASCSSKEELTPDEVLLGMGGDTWPRTELDDWLYQEFIRPYNMEVKYKWDPFEVNVQHNFIPVKEEYVKDFMMLLKKAWILPYEKTGCIMFVKRLLPKRYILLGNVDYNGSTPTNAAYAEGGRTVVFFNVNDFRKGDIDRLRRYVQTAMHEFTHIINQTIIYPTEWKLLTAQDYTGNWNSTPDAEFPKMGFVSKYSRASPTEDFADMVAYISTRGRAWFDEYVNSSAVGGDPGRSILRAKESIVVAYFKNQWNINFYETYPGAKDGLVDMIQEALKNL